MCNRDIAARRRQHGVTLVELLVGLVIGLLVVTAAITTMLLSRTTAAAVSDMTQLQQQGSFALRMFGTQARQAGSVELTGENDLGAVSFDSTFTGFNGTGVAVSGTEGIGGAPDTVSFSNQPSTALARDCLGNTAGARMDSTFSVVKGNLRCQGASGLPQPLVENVADFQVWYRVKTSPNSIRRMTAEEVDDAKLWNAVRSVEICLDLQGTETGDHGRSTHVDCDGKVVPRKGLLRVLFRNVFDLRTRGT